MGKFDLNILKNILFYARKVITVPSGECDNKPLAVMAVRNLSDYGFVIDDTGLSALCTASKEAIEEWYYKTSKRLSEMAGGNHTYHPFYPDFPEQVIEMDQAELLFNQITHYLSVAVSSVLDADFTWMPSGENRKQGIKSLEEHPLKVIPTVTETDEQAVLDMAAEIFKNTIKSKLNPSQGDMKNIINPYITAVEEWTADAVEIENRNLLSYLYLMAVNSQKDVSGMPALVVNDYMRIAQYHTFMKKKNLPEIYSFESINRKDEHGKVKKQPVLYMTGPLRRFIADGLESLGSAKMEEDFAKNPMQWKAVLRLMYTGSMKDHPQLKNAAYKLRNNVPLNTFYSRVEKAFSQGRYTDAVKMYASRPGEFVKNLNRMLCIQIKDVEECEKYAVLLLEKTKEVFAKTRPEDLIRLIAYLNSRKRADRLPIHNVNGVLVRTDKVHVPLPDATADLFKQLAEEGIAKQIYTGNSYGKVYIDKNLENVPLPSEISDTSEAMNAYPRGTRIKLETDESGNPKNVRVFIWWTNIPDKECSSGCYGEKLDSLDLSEFDTRGVTNMDNMFAYCSPYIENRVDLDLSVNMFSFAKEGSSLVESVSSVSFWDELNYKNAVVHSGDITDGGKAGGKGVVEYVDIDLMELRKNNVDLVQIYVNSYTGQPFGVIPHLGGWQVRKELKKSQQFDIKAVQQACELNPKAKGVTMAVVDVKNGDIIWTDSRKYSACAGSNSSLAAQDFSSIIERYMQGDQMTMKELAELAVKTNGGEFTDSIKDADTIFSMDAVEAAQEGQRVITAKDQDVWIGEFMSPQIIREDKAEEQQEHPETNTAADMIANKIGDIY